MSFCIADIGTPNKLISFRSKQTIAPTDGFNNEDWLPTPDMPNTKKNKKKWIIGLCLLIILCIAFPIFIFKNGYRLPQRDQHKQWQLFPNGSNPAILISSIDSLYVFA